MRRSGRRQFENREWVALKRHYKFRCVRCGRKEDPDNSDTWLTADHVIPVMMGGSKGIGNIQPLCKSCNWAKAANAGDKWDYRWRKFKS